MLYNRGYILECILEIVFAILIIVISIPIWDNFEKSGYAEIAEYYSNYEIAN